MVERRSYHSPMRAEQTAIARARVLDAAHASFLERGYAGTTVAGVSAAAGVSVQTVYNLVGGKPAILKAVYDATLAGDDEPVPMRVRPAFRAMLAAPDGRTCLVHYAALSRELGERTLPLLVVLLSHAAGGDTDLRDFAATIESERATGTRATATHVAERFGLRPDLDVDAAADVLWMLTAPDVADRLVLQRAWGWSRFERWLGVTMADLLLGPARRDSTR